jgi:hypothetical protein
VKNLTHPFRRGAQAASGSARKFVAVSKANLSFAAVNDYMLPFFSRSDPRPDGFNSSIFAAQEGEGFRTQGQNSFGVMGGSPLD